MSYINNYKQRISRGGNNGRELAISKAQHQMTSLASRSPALKRVSINDVDTSLLIVSSDEPTMKNIRAMPNDDFSTGSIVYWQESHWLITKRDLDDDLSTKGVMQQCNRQLMWQNPKTLEIVSRWCTADKPYFSNLSKTKELDQSTREFKIQIPYDEETSLIGLNHRFMLEVIDGEPKTYRTTCVDPTTARYDVGGELKGFLEINVEQDQYNPSTDSKEMGVCNYVEKPSITIDTPSESDNPIQFSYRGNASIRSGGSAKRITIVSDGIDTFDISVVVDDSIVDYINVSKSENSVTLKALDYIETIGHTIQMIASAEIDGETVKNTLYLEVVS